MAVRTAGLNAELRSLPREEASWEACLSAELSVPVDVRAGGWRGLGRELPWGGRSWGLKLTSDRAGCGPARNGPMWPHDLRAPPHGGCLKPRRPPAPASSFPRCLVAGDFAGPFAMRATVGRARAVWALAAAAGLGGLRAVLGSCCRACCPVRVSAWSGWLLHRFAARVAGASPERGGRQERGGGTAAAPRGPRQRAALIKYRNFEQASAPGCFGCLVGALASSRSPRAAWRRDPCWCRPAAQRAFAHGGG